VAVQTVTAISGRHLRNDNIDYRTGQWTTRTVTLPATAYNIQVGDSRYYPAPIRKEVAQHLIGVIGRQTIDGKRTLHLQGQVGSTVTQIWVEPRSYLAVRAVTAGTGIATASSPRLLFRWLPPTHANEAKTMLVRPKGFQHTG
jgi:hypothetical protein